jgi:hypothetical protein
MAPVVFGPVEHPQDPLRSLHRRNGPEEVRKDRVERKPPPLRALDQTRDLRIPALDLREEETAGEADLERFSDQMNPVGDEHARPPALAGSPEEPPDPGELAVLGGRDGGDLHFNLES